MATEPADNHVIHTAAMPRQGGVIPSVSGFNRFMQLQTRQNFIGIGTETIPAEGVKDQLGRDNTEVENMPAATITLCVIS
jgi:hypothetical protein